MAKKFPTYKRYCGAGAESALAFVDQLFSTSSAGNSALIVIYHTPEGVGFQW